MQWFFIGKKNFLYHFNLFEVFFLERARKIGRERGREKQDEE
jgi:hypothetical protein